MKKKEPVKVKVVNLNGSKEIDVFESLNETVRTIRKKYNVKICSAGIKDRLTGKTTTPYKGRFMFYRVDENKEVAE